MRLNKMRACLDESRAQKLTGLAFELKTATLDPPIFLELDSLGESEGEQCREYILGANQMVDYLEVAYDKKGVNSVFAKVSSGRRDQDTNLVFGMRQDGDQTKGWSFNQDN
mmetsp:Transcript_37264/g.49023  ORF Transcript_37264/g.49023 Transcript_37264/m.49023 type:complete len:111 (+) Transcript_37264:72-404(+)